MAPFRLPDPLPWPQIAGPLAAAEDGLARLDERLRASPIRAGWIARTHFTDALAGPAPDGGPVDLEDLVLHDAGMDIRAPTPGLARAHVILSWRRRIAAAPAGWALTASGLDTLRGRRGRGGIAPASGREHGAAGGDDAGEDDAGDVDTAGGTDAGPERASTPASARRHGNPGVGTAGGEDPANDDAVWAADMAALDALVARTGRALAGLASPRPTPALHDASASMHDERDAGAAARLADWRWLVDRTDGLPPVLAAALALEAWEEIAPLPAEHALGGLLAADLLRQRGKARAHLPCLGLGLGALPRSRRRPAGGTPRLVARIDAIAAAAGRGLADHDRWLQSRRHLERRLAGRRSTSHLPALIDLILATPIASAGMIARALGITPRAAQDLVADLGLREITGRGRYRAWGIL